MIARTAGCSISAAMAGAFRQQGIHPLGVKSFEIVASEQSAGQPGIEFGADLLVEIRCNLVFEDGESPFPDFAKRASDVHAEHSSGGGGLAGGSLFLEGDVGVERPRAKK